MGRAKLNIGKGSHRILIPLAQSTEVFEYALRLMKSTLFPFLRIEGFWILILWR